MTPLKEKGFDNIPMLNRNADKVKNNKPQSRRKIINGSEKGLTYVEQESRKIQQEGKNKEKAVDAIKKVPD